MDENRQVCELEQENAELQKQLAQLREKKRVPDYISLLEAKNEALRAEVLALTKG
jgi:cell division protein FtsB